MFVLLCFRSHPQQPDEEWEKSFLYNSSAHTKFIVKEFVTKAVEQRKIPVFAAIDCQAKWIEDSDKTASGKLDTRVVETVDGAHGRCLLLGGTLSFPLSPRTAARLVVCFIDT